MLELHIKQGEEWDEIKQEFVSVDAQMIQLEHSLISISKWESKYHKAFLNKNNEKNQEEMIDYIRFMCLTKNVDPNVFYFITNDQYNQINDYIENPMTATTFSNNGKPIKGQKTNEVITSELIYYWMIAYNIPSEYQKWHLNRLMTLIEVCSRKNQPGKKMSNKDVLSQYASLNAARRKPKL